jgi:mono/diheme cytochrome c family protein
VKPVAAGSGTRDGAAPAAAILPVPVGATREMVISGDRIYHGEKGGASCTGCHGTYGTGTPLGPNVTDATWLWGNGSYDSIRSTIQSGVLKPKLFRNPMPPMGGAQLSREEVAALAAYVWGLSHR